MKKNPFVVVVVVVVVEVDVVVVTEKNFIKICILVLINAGLVLSMHLPNLRFRFFR